MDNSTGTKALSELLVLGIVVRLRFFFGVQVVQVAEELVEAVVGGQMLVAVTQMVLTELTLRVPQRLQ